MIFYQIRCIFSISFNINTINIFFADKCGNGRRNYIPADEGGKCEVSIMAKRTRY